MTTSSWRQDVTIQRTLSVLFQLGMAAVAYFLAYGLRFDFQIPSSAVSLMGRTLPLMLIARAVGFGWFQLHRGSGRSIDRREALTVAKAVTLGSLLFLGTVAVLDGGVLVSICLLDWILCFGLVTWGHPLIQVKLEQQDKGRARYPVPGVDPAELLGRSAIDLDRALLRRCFEGRRILVSGAAGSIGSEICRQLLQHRPSELVILDQSESALYFLDLELRRATQSTAVHPVVGDVVDRRKMEDVTSRFRPQIVFHAAAYKHVPLMEADPLEAIRNNVIGTHYLLRAAEHAAVERFVLVSTDKAVRPVGVMGMTKRVAECVLRTCAPSGCHTAAVRFGNVLGSVGSVLPLFQWQAAQGNAVTVTDPDATRFFMLISEAAQLVLQAGAMAQGGETYVLEMGAPVKMGELADRVLRLAGLEPGVDVDIEMIGLRPGERLNEELVRDSEELRESEHDNVRLVVHDTLDRTGFVRDYETLLRAVEARSADEALRCLTRLAQQY